MGTPAIPNLGKHCSVDDCHGIDFLPFTCDCCKQPLVPVELTEAETEYAVNFVKHIFDHHVVFQYNCTNTIPEQLLENVTVIVDASEAKEFSEVGVKPLTSLPYDTPAQTLVAFEKPKGVPAVGKFSNTLRFTVKEGTEAVPNN